MKTMTIEIPAANESANPHKLPFGGKNPVREELAVNQRYFLRNGQPWFPVMGEIHYSRYPRKYWEESILKMQSGGIDIIATYIFWLHHEEIEGALQWDGDCDLRYFVELCTQHHLKVFLRIGPWCHGEARNGGFPDWLLQKDFEPRTNDERYLAYVRRWYDAIYQQVAGLLYQDGGPIIGIQLENEYGHCGGLCGDEGKRHMMLLKQIAQEVGFDVPFYTATGWGGGIVVEGEMLPVMSAYADHPWAQHTHQLPPSIHYLFSADRDDNLVGADLATQATMLTYTPEKYPYALAELGPGNQCTYHRRPILTAEDIEAFVLVKLGSGANLLGYYMFHGGSHPIGKLSTMQESRETGYLNDLPVKSYDFQAPIREFGQISDKYRALKLFHLFLHDFGKQLAQTHVILPPENSQDASDVASLRCAVRDHHGSGFLFLNNYQRHLTLEDKTDCAFQIASGAETIEFPTVDLRSGRYCILPYNLHIGHITLKSATAQLLCTTTDQNTVYYFFFAYPDLPPQYIFAKEGIQTIQSHKAVVAAEDDRFSVQVTQMGLESIITIESQDGSTIKIVTLTRQQAENCWKTELWGQERLVISDGDVTFPDDALQICAVETEHLSFALFPNVDTPLQANGQELDVAQEGIFAKYVVRQDKRDIPVTVQELPGDEHGWKQWEITVPVDELTKVNDIFLRIDFEGDIARLFLDQTLVADWFYDGRIWEVGLKRFADQLTSQKFRLKIFPLLKFNQLYLEQPPHYEQDSALILKRITAVPQYRVMIQQAEQSAKEKDKVI
jgi:beta-galactosidase